MRKLSYLLMLFFMITFIFSCNKDVIEPINQNEKVNDIFNKRKEVAKLFSNLMDDKVLINNLFEECEQGFCNETEILFSKVLNVKTGEGNSVKEQFKKKYNYNIDNYVYDDPLLCLYLFKPSNKEPNKIKVYVDKIISDYNTTEDVFFYENGIENLTKITEIPNESVFVLKTNERTFAADIKTNEVAYNQNISWPEIIKDYYLQFGSNDTDTENNYLLTVGRYRIYSKYKNYGNASIKKDKNIGLRSCPTGLDRDCIDGYEVISAMKWNDHREPWIKGGPEWVVRYSLGTLTNPNVANPQLTIFPVLIKGIQC